MLDWLRRLFPIAQVVVEDIKAQTKGKPRWDTAFSPLEVGKQWFYDEVRKQFSEKELVDLSLAIIAINGWNRLAIPFRSEPGHYQPGDHGKR